MYQRVFSPAFDSMKYTSLEASTGSATKLSETLVWLFSFSGFEGEALLHRLDLMGIQVSTGSACDSVNTQISQVKEFLSKTDDLFFIFSLFC